MAKVFTIAAGLENMGALRSGGQGSVYKARRVGEIITAIKILPTPIFSETGEDRNYTVFQSEVQKLQKVNEEPNPHVASILGSGITDSGNFPYIEMEFIEGPDLGDLLQAPHAPVFTIREAIKVATQLSDALAHCHKLDVKHGDIKSNNIKFNVRTGNYVLLDFGMAIMSDEQRRTSLRHAGAIEFMAPEQNDGKILFETDVYSFGVILFELLAGRVPFPLNDNGETSRNAVMMAHLETSPPDLLLLRNNALPAQWPADKKSAEMAVPQWLVALIYKCLEKLPAQRFANGVALHDQVIRNSITGDEPGDKHIQLQRLQNENLALRNEKKQLTEQLELAVSTLQKHNGKTEGSTAQQSARPKGNWLPWLLLLVFVALSAYLFFKGESGANRSLPKNDTPARVAASLPPLSDSAIIRLNEARVYLASRALPQALEIYRSLSAQDVPEGMYQYSTLALQGRNPDLNCKQAFDLLLKTAKMGYPSAQRTVGFLYRYADQPTVLTEAGYGERCAFAKNSREGSKLLMQAVIGGDTIALRLVESLNGITK